jgi:hypothetical protein
LFCSSFPISSTITSGVLHFVFHFLLFVRVLRWVTHKAMFATPCFQPFSLVFRMYLSLPAAGGQTPRWVPVGPPCRLAR